MMMLMAMHSEPAEPSKPSGTDSNLWAELATWCQQAEEAEAARERELAAWAERYERRYGN
jgi:hypothetical protein